MISDLTGEMGEMGGAEMQGREIKERTAKKRETPQ